jgi:hypothetical protein
MPSPTSLVISARTLGLLNYKAGNKVWLVSLDPKFGRLFVEGTISNDELKNGDFYKLQFPFKDGLSAKMTPKGLERTLGEMLIVDGLTREYERVLTTKARLLNFSLNAMDAVGIGYTAFTHYPVLDGETAAIRPGTPHGQFYTDAEVKIVDLFARCNERTDKEPSITTLHKPHTITVEPVLDLKKR